MKTVLVAIAGLLMLSACSGGAPRAGDEGAPAPLDPAIAARGEAFYTDWGCADCHGESLEGMDGVPSLADLGDRWTVESLVRYLEDPVGYAEENPEVRALQDRYPDIEMPAYDFTDEGERSDLAAWLLGGS